MTNSLNRGGSGGERRDLRSQPNRSSRRYRDAPERCPPGPMNQPRPPTHARGSRRGRGGGGTYAAPPPPQPDNGGLIQVRVRSRKAKGFRAFCFSVSVNLYAGTLVYDLLQFLAGKLIN